MRPRFLRPHMRQWLISFVLVALGVRALIPVGFMPSSERPFTLEICPDGFPSQLLHAQPMQSMAMGDADASMATHHHPAASGDAEQAPTSHHPGHGTHEQGARAEHCVFAAAAGVGPAPHPLVVVAQIAALAAPQFALTSPLPDFQRHRVQQPRAPPALS